MTDLLTTAQAAAELGISAIRIRQLIHEERLPATKFGHMFMIARSDLERLDRRRPGRPRRADDAAAAVSHTPASIPYVTVTP